MGTGCCARRLLATQPDFLAQASLLEEAALQLGVEALFLPKFHCELNYIEYLWGYSKCDVRRRTDGSRDKLMELVPSSLRTCPLSTIRRWSRRMWRMVFAYSQPALVAESGLVEFVCKRYKSHRDIPVYVGKLLDDLKTEFKEKKGV